MLRGRSLRPSIRPVFLVTAALLLAAIAAGRAQVFAEGSQWKEIPPVETIEERLFVKLNEERAANGLGRLRLSPELVVLARLQSREMARLGILMHLSAKGESLKERLDRARLLYIGSGENVARSETFVPELIHESFMKSPEHRANILKPDFDEVGIGVVLSPDNGYFITVDFVAGLRPKDGEEVRNFLLDRLNEVRRRDAGPDLVLIPEANEIAAAYSRARGAGRRVEADPQVLGPATVHFMSGADLDGIAGTLTGRAATSPPAGGIGSWFGRTDEYPGGAYYVCAILLHSDPSRELRTAQLREAVLEAANEIRLERNLEPLSLDRTLSQSLQNSLKRESLAAPPPLGAYVAAYDTFALGDFPEVVRLKIEDKAYGRVGLAVVRKPGKGLVVAYTVIILLGE